MKKAKTTKRALLMSVLSMLLCVSMLVGSTFAWFTDTVTSGNNKIVAGNLSVDLVHVGGGEEGKDVSIKENPTHLIFDYEKWEPGYTTLATLKVENKGTLALQYKLNVLIKGADEVTNDKGEKTTLADVIDVYVYYGSDYAKPASFADITAEDSKWQKAGTLASFMADPNKAMASGNLLPEKAESKNDEPIGFVQMTVALHMQELAGNEYQGLSIGDLGLTLSAAQYTYESDSFGDQYDAGAEYEEGAEYTIEGVTVKLTEESYNSIKYHDKAGYENKIYSIELYSKVDLVSAVELINKDVICHNTTNDIHPKLIFKADIDFGGDVFTGLISNIDVEGNGCTLSNVKFVGDSSEYGKAGFIPYAGNNKVNGLTIKDATAIGAQAGIFGGNAANAQLTDCALAGSITVTYADAAKEDYNGVGAVFGVTSEGNSTVGVDVTNAKITIITDGITYPGDFAAETGTNLVGVVYGGSYTIQ